MTLREQILASPETLSDLAWAAEQRYREAEELFSVGRFSGSVYLLGLSAEMWLKLACFYTRGATPATSVDSQLGPSRQWMKLNAPVVLPESYHSLAFWAEFLIRLQRQRGTPATLIGRIRHHVMHRLHQDWKIDMRYRSVAVSHQHAWRVYNDVTWDRSVWKRFGRL